MVEARAALQASSLIRGEAFFIYENEGKEET
jgi:hypothetical protein